MRRPPESVKTNSVQIPRMHLVQHQRTMLAVDIMFIDRVPFLVRDSRGLNLVRADYTPSLIAKKLVEGITRV